MVESGGSEVQEDPWLIWDTRDPVARWQSAGLVGTGPEARDLSLIPNITKRGGTTEEQIGCPI